MLFYSTMVMHFSEGGEGSRPDMMELIADTMNFLQYNVMALGNHETDYGPDALHKLRAMLQFPMIASNVKGSEVEALGIKSHIMIPIGKNNRHLCIVGGDRPLGIPLCTKSHSDP